jgi:hypothetical protein
LAQLPDAAQFQVALIDVPDRLCFGRIDDQPPLAKVIPKRRHAPHPHPLFLGSRYLVPDALTGDLPLELGEREQDIEGQSAHRGGGVELLSDGDERDVVDIE